MFKVRCKLVAFGGDEGHHASEAGGAFGVGDVFEKSEEFGVVVGVGGVGARQADVVGDRAIEEVRPLRHPRDRATPGGPTELLERPAVDDLLDGRHGEPTVVVAERVAAARRAAIARQGWSCPELRPDRLPCGNPRRS